MDDEDGKLSDFIYESFREFVDVEHEDDDGADDYTKGFGEGVRAVIGLIVSLENLPDDFPDDYEVVNVDGKKVDGT